MKPKKYVCDCKLECYGIEVEAEDPWDAEDKAVLDCIEYGLYGTDCECHEE